MPVTSLPCHRRRPALGTSSPAISRISDVLPASVGPSSTFIVPASSVRSVGWICTSPPATFDTPSTVSVMTVLPRSSLCGLRMRGLRRPLLPHPCLQFRDLRLGHLQTQPRAPPHDIRGLPREFVLHLPPHLGPGQRRAEIRAEIGRRAGLTHDLCR